MSRLVEGLSFLAAALLSATSSSCSRAPETFDRATVVAKLSPAEWSFEETAADGSTLSKRYTFVGQGYTLRVLRHTKEGNDEIETTFGSWDVTPNGIVFLKMHRSSLKADLPKYDETLADSVAMHFSVSSDGKTFQLEDVDDCPSKVCVRKFQFR